MKFGLGKLYHKQKSIQHAMRCSYALCFVPKEKVVRAFNLLVINSPPGMEGYYLNVVVESSDIIFIVSEYYHYIADNYIGLTMEQSEQGENAFKVGAVDPAVRDSSFEFEEPEQTNLRLLNGEVEIAEEPRYPISVWSVNKRAKMELPRTNNSLESFNGIFKVYIKFSSLRIKNFLPKNISISYF